MCSSSVRIFLFAVMILLGSPGSILFSKCLRMIVPRFVANLFSQGELFLQKSGVHVRENLF